MVISWIVLHSNGWGLSRQQPENSNFFPPTQGILPKLRVLTHRSIEYDDNLPRGGGWTATTSQWVATRAAVSTLCELFHCGFWTSARCSSCEEGFIENWAVHHSSEWPLVLQSELLSTRSNEFWRDASTPVEYERGYIEPVRRYLEGKQHWLRCNLLQKIYHFTKKKQTGKDNFTLFSNLSNANARINPGFWRIHVRKFLREQQYSD